MSCLSPQKYYDPATFNHQIMLNWIKGLFGKKEGKPAGCCGGGCCGHENRNQESGTSGPDFRVSQTDLEKLAKVDSLVVVGKVIELRAHSNPDMTRVRVSRCDLGNGEIVQILCGGTNLENGQTVVVAKGGAVLPGDFQIGERDIRGEVSSGMICASKELGLEREEGDKVIWPLPSGFDRFIGQSINQLV